jgi:hypothetical protein
MLSDFILDLLPDTWRGWKVLLAVVALPSLLIAGVVATLWALQA